MGFLWEIKEKKRSRARDTFDCYSGEEEEEEEEEETVKKRV